MPDLDPQTASLLETLSARLGRRLEFELAASGGCISTCFVARVGQEKVFVKTGAAEHLPLFEAEADGLAALALAGTHRVPEALALGLADATAFLVLDWLDLKPIQTRDEALAAGLALAELHRRPLLPGKEGDGEGFGWHRDNFIGATPQANPVSRAWPLFFARQRLQPQLDLAKKNGYPRDFIADGEKLVERVPAFFVDHKPSPSLLHGDLWHGNTGIADGRPALFDPAVYRGDREVDLAMSELFGGLPDAFYSAYRQAWPLAAGFEQRKQLYNLYHILNHLNLFGRGYLGQAQRMIKRLLAEARG